MSAYKVPQILNAVPQPYFSHRYCYFQGVTLQNMKPYMVLQWEYMYLDLVYLDKVRNNGKQTKDRIPVKEISLFIIFLFFFSPWLYLLQVNAAKVQWIKRLSSFSFLPTHSKLCSRPLTPSLFLIIIKAFCSYDFCSHMSKLHMSAPMTFAVKSPMTFVFCLL